MIRRLAIIVSVSAITTVSVAARAQSVSSSAGGAASNPMLAICSGFLAQGAGSVSGDKSKLCNCLVRDTSTKLSTSDMEAYAQASLNSQTPPKDVMDKVMAIATSCLQEAQ
ncbi:MAG: hypothetical protein EPO08_09050 [Rhodospirillaceae bacterium]|nr:MAG: hypothetical protein EPO08_09050 [Rhodospirillaceae bacterium]